ncbi:MAG: hypothetical protein IJ678_02345 [Kiritimatiellae bacterium]|nr:hypothetical protein [Kiritimatiellia bacterium]
MKYQNLAAIAAATGALAIGSAADTVTEWWDVDFESAAEGEFELSLAVDGGTFTKENENDKSAVYAFSAEDAEKYDETDGKALNLNTEGSTLTFQPSVTSSSATQTVVDADVWFVGAESDPASGSFDSEGDVQVAVYLKVTDDESVAPELMAYSYDDGVSEFKSLPNAASFEFADKSWYHIQILVDRTAKTATYKVGAKGCAEAELVNLGTLPLANSNGTVDPVSEVGFRGTGMVDNFVGKQIEVSTLELQYLAKAYDVDGAEIEDFLTLDPSSDSTITAVIPGFDSTEAPLVRVKVYAADGSVAGNYATVVDAENGTVEIEELELGPDYELSLDIDVSSFVENEEGGLVLELFYGTDPDAVEPGEFPTQEEFATAMAEAGLAIDPDAEEGFVVTFEAPYAGQYKLQYSATPNGPFADEAGEGAAATAEAAGDQVKLVGDAAQDARFFRVKLYE